MSSLFMNGESPETFYIQVDGEGSFYVSVLQVLNFFGGGGRNMYHMRHK